MGQTNQEEDIMKKLALPLVLSIAMNNVANAEIILSSKIKKDLKNKINRDLTIIKEFKFKKVVHPEALSVLGLKELNANTASTWLNQRVNYVIEENALSVFKLLFKRVIYVAEDGVTFPNAGILPYSMGTNYVERFDSEQLPNENGDTGATDEGQEAKTGFTVMSNIGAALYLSGKQENQVYGLKVSRGFLRPSKKVEIISPRSGVIQIGEGLFAPELTINRENENALANTIFRMGTFFHEARHSDGNAESLGFTHATCPETHDYAGAAACDENLNGPYTVGKVMLDEMTNACGDKCSEADKEILNLMIIDNASRILKTTHKGEEAKNWDATPESL